MQKLAELRSILDQLDARLLEVLAKRFEVCRDVATYKAEAHIPMMQPARAAEVKRRAIENGQARGLDGTFMAALYDLVIAEACRIEDEILRAAGRGAS
jgi:chorismate mutase-like protein